MVRAFLMVLLALPILAAFGACVQTVLQPIPVEPVTRSVSYLDEVQPILDSRCVVCHSCYNAACQLQLGSFEGVGRGGTKTLVYDSARIVQQSPTRLFFDAQTPAEWRKLGFHSVTDSRVDGSTNDSTMLHLLDAKRRSPDMSDREYRPEESGLTCPADSRELGAFLARHPDRGMPFGFPPLSGDEYDAVAAWLAQGARGPTPEEQSRLVTPSAPSTREIEKWERFLNHDDPKHAMTARYLYEHYFMAHLYFREASPLEFYQLVRSSTPPGEPIRAIATVRPYDDPGTWEFYYRFRKIHSTIVHKTHIVVELDDARLDRMRELFIEPEWLAAPETEPLGDRAAANPFVIYAQIPASSRYQFLLDHSEYIIRTFIRGPVCKGQVALNVIHDHFWLLFLDPAADQTVLVRDFLVEQANNLRLPTEQGSQELVLRTFSNRYRERYRRFFRAKMDLYQREEPQGFGIDSIWKGERASDAPILTVYRHFDSASVHRGALGDLPRTLWVIDYPQLERIYYALVAGFDVFGNVSHQVNVRRYMDYLRMEGELNFLQFMPEEKRLPMLHSWYLGDRAIENVGTEDVYSSRPTRVRFETDDPKRELLETLVGDHFPLEMGIRFDPINYTWDGRAVPMPSSFDSHEEVLNGFRALTQPGTGFITHVTETEVNVLLIRVRDYQGADRFFTIVINRWHDNVNSMFGEARTLDPSKDTIDFLPGSIGSYPNYFFDITAEDVPDFFDLLENFDGSPEYLEKIERYGVNRSEPGFWQTYDWFQAQMNEADPVTAGRYDLNRYHPSAE